MPASLKHLQKPRPYPQLVVYGIPNMIKLSRQSIITQTSYMASHLICLLIKYVLIDFNQMLQYSAFD